MWSYALTLSRASPPQRFGVSRAVHPRLEDAAPRGAPLTYEFDDTLVVPATLYKARTGAVTERAQRRYRGAFEYGLVPARVHCCAPVARHALTDFLCLCTAVPLASQSTASSRGGVRSRFGSKELVLTLLEVDPSGKSAVDVGTLTLDLGQLVDTEAATKTLAVVPLPGVPSAFLSTLRAPPVSSTRLTPPTDTLHAPSWRPGAYAHAARVKPHPGRRHRALQHG